MLCEARTIGMSEVDEHSKKPENCIAISMALTTQNMSSLEGESMLPPLRSAVPTTDETQWSQCPQPEPATLDMPERSHVGGFLLTACITSGYVTENSELRTLHAGL